MTGGTRKTGDAVPGETQLKARHHIDLWLAARIRSHIQLKNAGTRDEQRQ